MKNSQWFRRAQSWLLTAVMIGGALLSAATPAFAAGDEDDNLLNFPVADSDELKTEVDMGNLLLFSGGNTTGEAEDDGVADDSAFSEDGEVTGEEGDDGGEDLPASTIGRVIGSNVKLRASASAIDEVVAELNEGATLTIESKENGWLKVTFGILSGYVHSDYVFEVTAEGLNGTILRDGVNLRQTGSIDGTILAQLKAGTGVQVTDYINGWYAVTYDDKEGFVRNDCITVTGAFSGETSTRMLKQGMSGDSVKRAQEELRKRGFFIGETTGDYGSKTVRAVKDFQKEAKLKADGILGEQTLDLLYSSNTIRVTIATASQVKGRVQMTEWSRVNGIIPRGRTYRIIDVRTGTSWNESRYGGYLHIDTEPNTADDTAKLKRVYGGRWSWNRRAVWIVYGSYVFAASINGMPHGGESNKGNGAFTGHHCIHFYRSQTHINKRQCPIHQAMVLASYKAGR